MAQRHAARRIVLRCPRFFWGSTFICNAQLYRSANRVFLAREDPAAANLCLCLWPVACASYSYSYRTAVGDFGLDVTIELETDLEPYY
jgi:hypothetical protein